jgi:hypothetical protein
MLASNIPDLEIEVRKRYGRDILADRGDGFEIWMEMRRVSGFDLFEQSSFACVVKAEKEDGVFLSREVSMETAFYHDQLREPSLAVA